MYESIQCFGFHKEGTDEEYLPDVILKMSRSDITEIQRFVKFAAEQSDQYGFIRDCVGMVERLRQVLIDHRERCEEDNENV